MNVVSGSIFDTFLDSWYLKNKYLTFHLNCCHHKPQKKCFKKIFIFIFQCFYFSMFLFFYLFPIAYLFILHVSFCAYSTITSLVRWLHRVHIIINIYYQWGGMNFSQGRTYLIFFLIFQIFRQIISTKPQI